MAALAHLKPEKSPTPHGPSKPDLVVTLLQRIRCAVCGGPEPDGSGCEYCPEVDG